MSDNPVRQVTLESLLMDSKPLAQIVMGTTTWAAIAKELSGVFLTYMRNDLPEHQHATYVAHLCTVYYTHNKNRVIHNREDAKWAPEQITPTVDFVQKFMAANGQWDYIERQSWYIKGDYVIAIDVNYYPDRSGFKEYPEFHKDTGGNNLFVNLIFDNMTDIEATEWFADLAEPSEKRKVWQQGLLPELLLTDLDHARKALAAAHGPNSDVRGGVSKGQHICVSWVDDLVWHSTPSTARRFVYTVAAAQRSYSALKATLNGKFVYSDHDFNAVIPGIEVLGTIAECTTTQLHLWLQKNGLKVQDLNLEVGRSAWTDLYQDDEASYVADAKERAKTEWRITGIFSEATADDDRLPGSVAIKETPVGLSGRRRSNSRDNTKAEIDLVREVNKGLPRSFLRTWVRILPKNSSELTDNSIVFT